MNAPGAYQPLRDAWTPFDAVVRQAQGPTLFVVDARVERLHPRLAKALQGKAVVRLAASEATKSWQTVERLTVAGSMLPRTSGRLVVVGGGTLGDVATVAAHVIKRGVALWQVPTTLLAAVDSSVGGKGAVNVAGVKNAAGVFHCAERTFLCPQFFSTLSQSALAQGRIEAFKMAVCLDARTWAQWSRATPDDEALVRKARALKARVCAMDPYELLGPRRVLNFGHTLGHVFESLSGYRIPHGEAVALGMLCALDLGRAEGLTRLATARDVEHVLHRLMGTALRETMQRTLKGVPNERVLSLLAHDKKATARTLKFVLLTRPGKAVVRPISTSRLEALLPVWRSGRNFL